MATTRRLLVLLTLFVSGVLLYLSASRGPVTSLRIQPDAVQDALFELDEASPTLGVFSQVFVVSRPTRLDRRATMQQLRAALSLDWTYVDAISSEDTLVDQVAECVRLSRKNNHLRTFDWPPRSDVDQVVRSPPLPPLDASVPWLFATAATPCRYPVPPPLNTSAHAPGLADNTSQSAGPSADLQSRAISPSSLPLTCAVQDRTHGVKYKPSLLSYMLLTPAKFACWYSHLDAIQRVAAYDDSLADADDSGARGAALILEDDVDMERDVRGRLREVWSVLPDDWDIVFLGECCAGSQTAFLS